MRRAGRKVREPGSRGFLELGHQFLPVIGQDLFRRNRHKRPESKLYELLDRDLKVNVGPELRFLQPQVAQEGRQPPYFRILVPQILHPGLDLAFVCFDCREVCQFLAHQLQIDQTVELLLTGPLGAIARWRENRVEVVRQAQIAFGNNPSVDSNQQPVDLLGECRNSKTQKQQNHARAADHQPEPQPI